MKVPPVADETKGVTGKVVQAALKSDSPHSHPKMYSPRRVHEVRTAFGYTYPQFFEIAFDCVTNSTKDLWDDYKKIGVARKVSAAIGTFLCVLVSIVV